MLHHQLQRDVGILVLSPDGPLGRVELAALTDWLDTYVTRDGPLRGVFVYARTFPGWREFGALLAQLQVLGQSHRGIAKIAVVAGSGFATVLAHIERHFDHPEVKCFGRKHEYAAWEWLMDNRGRRVQTRTAAA